MTIPQPSTIALHNLGNFMKFIFGSVKKAAKKTTKHLAHTLLLNKHHHFHLN